ANPAVAPVDLLVLDFQHLAAPAAGIECADDPVAHLVAGCQLRITVPDALVDDVVAQRRRDLERERDLALWYASLSPCTNFGDLVPRQLRGASRRRVAHCPGAEQPWFLGFGYPPLASAFILRRDPHPT